LVDEKILAGAKLFKTGQIFKQTVYFFFNIQESSSQLSFLGEKWKSGEVEKY
jgi:hypothetical protein